MGFLQSQYCTKNNELENVCIQLMALFLLSMSGIFGIVQDLRVGEDRYLGNSLDDMAADFHSGYCFLDSLWN